MEAHAKFQMKNSAIVEKSQLQEFLAGSVEEDLETVPGIGPANKAHLIAAGVETVHQLIAMFLSFRGPGVGVAEHIQAFNRWLAEAGINASRASIVRCIAEKVDTFIPGTFDAGAFAS